MEGSACQLEELDLMSQEVSLFGKGLHFMRRVSGFFRNRMHLLKYTVNRRVLKKNRMDTIPVVETFNAGDKVRVKSKEEISKFIDGWQHYKGCRYMYEMWQYCGTTHTVYKKVNRFLDEQTMKMMKSDGNLYILEGLICEGSWPYPQCDRSCFYFWRGEWLERAE